MIRQAAVAFLLAALAARPSLAMAGPATVIDGDTIVVAGERVRLQGIDAPELHQTCTAYGQEWPCGQTSAQWLREYLQSQTVECVGHARDRYGRLLAVCYVGAEDLNERIVRQGWAPDFRDIRRTTCRRNQWPGALGERSGNEGCFPRDYGV